MNVLQIPLHAIRVSTLNTRKDLDAGTEDGGIDQLAESIRRQGLLNPVTVRAISENEYELIAGQRRFIACRSLDIENIAAIVRHDLNDTDATVLSLVENVHRADMNPIDKARAYKALLAEYGNEKLVAKETGITAPTVKRYLSLLKLASPIQEKVSTSEGPAGIGTLAVLANTFSPEEQEQVINALKGFRQDVQLDILKRSGGNIEAIPGLKEQAMEGAFDVRTCREGLCFDLPSRWKHLIQEGLNTESGVSLPVPRR